MSLNQCQFVGNLGGNPEIRSMQNGDKVANFSLACTERWRNKSGEKQERTTWVPIVIFGPLAGVAESYLRKGSKVFVQGKFSVRKWTAKDGSDRYSTEVVLQGPGSVLTMLDSPSGQREPDGSRGAPANNDGWIGQGPDDEDEIPFVTSESIF